MTNEELETKSQSENKSERGLVSKLLWSAALPCTAPYMFNVGGNHKEKLAALLLVGTLGFNINSTGFLINEQISKTEYKLEQTDLIHSTYKIKKEIGEYQAFNRELKKDYLNMAYMGASIISPIPVAKIGLTILDKKSDKYTEESIDGKFDYYFEDDKTKKSVLGGSCDVTIYQENFNKLNNIKSYILDFGGDDVQCEYAWGYDTHGMNTENFGWAHKRLKSDLIK